jgi:hypothetical protein
MKKEKIKRKLKMSHLEEMVCLKIVIHVVMTEM